MSQCVTTFVTNVTILVTMSRNVVPSSVQDTLRSLSGPGLAAVASTGLASQPLSASIQARPVQSQCPGQLQPLITNLTIVFSDPDPGRSREILSESFTV